MHRLVYNSTVPSEINIRKGLSLELYKGIYLTIQKTVQSSQLLRHFQNISATYQNLMMQVFRVVFENWMVFNICKTSKVQPGHVDLLLEPHIIKLVKEPVQGIRSSDDTAGLDLRISV